MEVEEDAQPVSYLVWRAIDAAVIATFKVVMSSTFQLMKQELRGGDELMKK